MLIDTLLIKNRLMTEISTAALWPDIFWTENYVVIKEKKAVFVIIYHSISQ